MFKLTKTELDHALDAINHHGYSTMLPAPPEWEVVNRNWVDIRDAIEQIDLDNYAPFKPMQVFAPKSRANIRIIHILHPQDLLIYTALVMIVKNDIESARINSKHQRVFSYRSDVNNPSIIYKSGSFSAYRAQLTAKADGTQIRFAAVADIADFYPRIYQHRLENVIETVAKTQRARDVARVLVKKLISNLMGRNSYGIPVGPYASRLLAEAILIDVDATLKSAKANFVRWVDDYNFFCKTEYEAQSILFLLGEWLYSKHGLTLHSAKTKIMTIDDYRANALIHPEEQITDRDAVVNMLRDFRFGYGDEEEIEPTEEEIDHALAVLQSSDLMGLLETSLGDSTLVDYQAVNYVLTRLPRIPGVSLDVKLDVLNLVVENSELLYPVAEQISKYVLSFSDLRRSEIKRIAKQLLKPLKSKRNPPPPFYAMWILHIFSSSSDWNHAEELVTLYTGTTSEVIKRYAAIALHASGGRSEVLAIKDNFSSASPLLKLAILFASNKLGQDERKHWKLSHTVNGVIEKMM